MIKRAPLILGFVGMALLARQLWMLQTQGIALPAEFHWPKVIEFCIGLLLVCGWFSGLWHKIIKEFSPQFSRR